MKRDERKFFFVNRQSLRQPVDGVGGAQEEQDQERLGL